MQVGKWGDSLAVRIPASIAEALDLKEGDEVTIEIAGTKTLRIARDQARADALAALSALAVNMPPGWKFSPDEANER